MTVAAPSAERPTLPARVVDVASTPMVPLLVTESTPDACVVVCWRVNSSEGLRLMVAFHLSLCVLSAPSAVMPVAVEVAVALLSIAVLIAIVFFGSSAAVVVPPAGGFDALDAFCATAIPRAFAIASAVDVTVPLLASVSLPAPRSTASAVASAVDVTLTVALPSTVIPPAVARVRAVALTSIVPELLTESLPPGLVSDDSRPTLRLPPPRLKIGSLSGFASPVSAVIPDALAVALELPSMLELSVVGASGFLSAAGA